MRKANTGFSAPALTPILQACVGDASVLKVAYSGGMDSHVLLHALSHLRADFPWGLSALHVDHGLHADSRQWALHCRRVCEQLGIGCTVERIEGLSSAAGEGAARRARYDRLAQHIDAGEVLLTAHHLDDQAETVLLQLLRGAGVRGLAAMPELMPFARGLLLRPLLAFGRAELRDYARAHDLHWIEDTSNRDLAYTRNAVRHELLPLMRRRWPRASESLARAGRHAAEALELLDDLAVQDLGLADGGAGDTLRLSALRRLTPARQRNALRYWIRRCGYLVPSTPLTTALVRLVHSPTRSEQGTLRWPGAEVRRYRDTIVIMRPLPAKREDVSIPWDPRERVLVPGTGYALRAEVAVGQGLSRARVDGVPLSVRLRRGGEQCRLPGRTHRHKLKKLLQASGLPPWVRERLPLVYAGEELAAIGDRWVCAPFAAEKDEPSLRIVLERAENAQGVTPVV